jgi:cytoskeleton protein RodZ
MSLAMGVFGERLRREREMRGITLEEISGSTKISKRHLQALEQEDFDALPGGIFNKGFVRAYARYVGIDEEQAVADYLAADQQEAPAELRFPLEVHRPVDMNPRRSYTPVLLALLVLIIILAGWGYWVKHRSQQVVTPESSGGRGTSKSVGDTAASTAPVANPVPSSNAPGAGADSDQTQTPAQPDSGQFTVLVKANESSWISIRADGRTEMERIFSPGEEQSTSATREITLTIGNAAGVEVRFNGTPQGALGQQSKVRVLTFTPEGLQSSPVPQAAPRLQ